MAPLISVIVPVYKAEDTLRNCVDSILKQTNRDFELLLIDDGSPDRCREICDTYAAKDARVRVWHKENGGVRYIIISRGILRTIQWVISSPGIYGMGMFGENSTKPRF